MCLIILPLCGYMWCTTRSKRRVQTLQFKSANTQGVEVDHGKKTHHISAQRSLLGTPDLAKFRLTTKPQKHIYNNT